MKTTKAVLILATTLIVFSFNRANVSAQPRGDFANMDPQQIQKQMQEQMMSFYRQQLVVTNDAEWIIVEGRLSKVLQARMEMMMSSGMGMMAAMRRGGQGGGGAGAGGFRGFPGFGQPSPEADALQKAIDDGAPADQIKAALQKVRESRKRKQADLVKAQEELRQVVTTRQEAVLVNFGTLD